MNGISRIIWWYQFYIKKIPIKWYFFLIILGFASAVILIKMNLRRKKAIVLWMVIEYYLLILVSTVFSRSRNLKRSYDLNFFNFVDKIYNGNIDNRFEVYLNILMLMPIGILLCVIYKEIHSIVSCLFLSLIIEFLQLIFYRGSFEISDLIMNTFGAMLGCVIYRMCFCFINIFLHNKHV